MNLQRASRRVVDYFDSEKPVTMSHRGRRMCIKRVSRFVYTFARMVGFWRVPIALAITHNRVFWASDRKRYYYQITAAPAVDTLQVIVITPVRPSKRIFIVYYYYYPGTGPRSIDCNLCRSGVHLLYINLPVNSGAVVISSSVGLRQGIVIHASSFARATRQSSVTNTTDAYQYDNTIIINHLSRTYIHFPT